VIDPNNSNSFEVFLKDLKASVSKDMGSRLPGQGKVAAKNVEVPDDLLALLEKLSGYRLND
jgi:hypothetical protein